MKIIDLVLFAFLFLFLTPLYSQAPDAFNYQAVLRNSGGQVMSSQSIDLKVQILDAVIGGSILYSEAHSVTTSPLGLINIGVGQGSNSSTAFDSLSWGSSAQFIEILIDSSGQGNYISMGTSQLLSVPYALYAKTSGSGGLQGPTGNDGTAGTNGTNGTNGVDGANGAQGPTGIMGTFGSAGINGTDGAQGPTGADGIQGPTGPAGADASPSLLQVSAYVFQSDMLPGGEHNVKWSASTTNPLAVVDADYSITDDTLIIINTTGRYRVSYEVSCSNVNGGTLDNSVEVWLKEDTGSGIIIVNGTRSFLNVGKAQGSGASSSRSVIYDFSANQKIFLNLKHFLGDGTLNVDQHGCQMKIERIL